MKRRVARVRPAQVRPSPVAAGLLTVGLVLGGLLGAAGSAAAGARGGGADREAAGAAPGHRDAAPVAPVDWGACAEAGEGDLECATVQVPLDHDRPNGPTIGVAVVRAPATAPDRRLGSLFVNPGGPGGSGVDVVMGIAPFLPAEIRERFDIVGFDPRGIMRSTPLRCYDTFEQALADLPPVPYPETPAEEDLVVAAAERLADACRRRGGPILAHMSTADVARDMDLLRRAVGDDGLTYLGLSYGSVLGQVYANLFPDRVRALVIDGVIDPRAWAGQGIERWTVPFATRLRSAESAQATLGEFFRLCDEAASGCAFSGGAADRFAALGDRLRAEPLVITDPSGTFRVTYNDLVAISLGALYAPFIWPELALLLQQLEEAVTPADVGTALASLRARLAPETHAAPAEEYPNFLEGPPGVACSDTENPRSYRWYRDAADRAESHGYFGRLWNWGLSACPRWPAPGLLDRYDGPWDARTANPVLVVGNLFDPATGYHGAVAAAELLPSSHLVTYTGWGHTAFLSAGNACVDEAVTAYLLTPTAPGRDRVCEAVGSPFAPRAEERSAAAVSPVVAATLPAAVRDALG